MNGFLNLLKPPGMTSSDAVVQIRRTLFKEKVGHAGTLDPEAAGVLPIMIGKASRLFDVLVDKQKAYVAEIAFGVATDTQDAQGHTITKWEGPLPDAAAITSVLPRFTGDLMQTPPAYSALKVAGQAAYKRARAGEQTQLAPRPARVDAITLLEMRPPDGALLQVHCGRGVYIRTLCHDIGQALGCGAHLRFLLRTQTGVFHLEDTVTLEAWQDADAAARAKLLMPMDGPLAHLPMARVQAGEEARCRSGMPMVRFEAIDAAARAGDETRVYCGERFAGLARWRDGALRFHAMLLD